jgi:hypothetical protein
VTLERYGVRGSEADGVFFTEAVAIDGARVEVKIGARTRTFATSNASSPEP